MPSKPTPQQASSSPRRYSILLAILLSYLVPILILSTYRAHILPQSSDWTVFSLGLLMGCVGSVCLFWQMQEWETQENQPLAASAASEAVAESVPEPEVVQSAEPSEDWEKKYSQLLEGTQNHQENMRQLQQDNENSQRMANDLQKELEELRNSMYEQLKQKDVELQDRQQALLEQRTVITKQEEAISALESREQELNYEIKTLLRFASLDNEPSEDLSGVEISPNKHAVQAPPEEPRSAYVQGVSPFTSKVSAPEAAEKQLQRCLEIASKMTNSQIFNHPSRQRDVPMDNYALDLRRLCDSLREENNSTIILFSQKDNKLLFVNDQIKTLLGWAPEAFVPEFTDIIQPGLDEWKKGLNHLMSNSEARLRILMRSKTGQTIPLNCHLGAIQAGLFRYHLIGVLYPV